MDSALQEPIPLFLSVRIEKAFAGSCSPSGQRPEELFGLEFEGYFLLFSTKNLDVGKIVRQYFNKDKVEKAFRCLKSTLGIRPIKHWLEERVKAHIFICYLSYLLISLLETRLLHKNISSINALDKLKTAYKIHLKNKNLKEEFTKIVTVSKEQRDIMKAIDKNIQRKR